MEMVAAIIAVVVVVAAAVTAAVVVLTSEGPTATVRNYIENTAGDRLGSAFNDTVWSLNKNLYPVWRSLIVFVPTNETVKITSLTEVTKSDMTGSQRFEMNLTANIIEGLFNVTVQNYCFVNANFTVTTTVHNEQHVDNETVHFQLVEVNGRWLIVLALGDLEDLLGISSTDRAIVEADT